MLFTALASFGAGLLTVLAPCVLPLLPVILGGSVDSRGDRRRPFLIAGSLVVSLVAFTLLLKASTVLIGVDPQVWTYLSGGLIVLLGVSMFFPGLWPRIAGAVGLEHGAQSLLGKAFANKNRTWSAILTGAALGPVFSSCSPTYAWAIATVLPASPLAGMVYLTLYCLGVGVALLAIALAGRTLLDRLGWARDPRGWFSRVIAGLFVLIGLSIITGLDKDIQTRLVDFDPLGINQVEQRLLPPAGENPGEEIAPEKVLARPAAEFVGITEWVNSEPLTLAGLRGQVVLVDFWTYSCINCQRTQPYLNAWNDRYRDSGLVIVGVHAPEFAFEQLPANVERAVRAAKITYPVGLDNDFATWNAYGNRYWPAKYLIDREGTIRYTHFGEGAYAETESRIRELLGEAAAPPVPVSVGDGGPGPRTAETYLGTARARGFAGTPSLGSPDGVDHAPASDLLADHWTLGGRWKATPEAITAGEDGAVLTLRYRGQHVYLVMTGPTGSAVRVSVDGQDVAGPDVGPDGFAQVSDPRLYHLVSAPRSLPDATLRLTFSKGVTAHAFTFG